VTATRRALTEHDVPTFVRLRCFAPTSPERIGIESEWLTTRLDDPASPVPPEYALQALDGVAPLPGQSTISFEPGGQIELSSPALVGLGRACAAIAGDLSLVRKALAESGIRMTALGREPWRAPLRCLRVARYEAMEAFFDSMGPEGKTMMCNTAALQINLDAGSSAEQVARRWRLAHLIGPSLAAAFANSPFAGGAPTGWRSSRLALWGTMDPSRTTPVPASFDPAAAWARYALRARVMMIRRSDSAFVPVTEPMTFAHWMSHGHALGWPTLEDFSYHLTTLFPPVRPRGYLELRMIDSIPDPWWRAAVGVTTALLYDEQAAGEVSAATASATGLWVEAFRYGLHQPELRTAADALFRIALEALPRVGADPLTLDAVAAFHDRYVGRGRCPADDLLYGWLRKGSLDPVQGELEA
jgi:glutamate--cysteine ligase